MTRKAWHKCSRAWDGCCWVGEGVCVTGEVWQECCEAWGGCVGDGRMSSQGGWHGEGVRSVRPGGTRVAGEV